MLASKTLIMGYSGLQTITAGDEYDTFIDREGVTLTINNQGDAHYFLPETLLEYFD